MTNEKIFNKPQELDELMDQKELTSIRKDYLNIKAPADLSARLIAQIQVSEVRKKSFVKIAWMPIGLSSIAALLMVVLLIKPLSNPSSEESFYLTSLPSLASTSLYLPARPTYSIPSSHDMTGISLVTQTPAYASFTSEIKK